MATIDLSAARLALATYVGPRRTGSPLHLAMLDRMNAPDDSEREVARRYGLHQTTLRRAMKRFYGCIGGAIAYEGAAAVGGDGP